jgi:hypothetical protein
MSYSEYSISSYESQTHFKDGVNFALGSFSCGGDYSGLRAGGIELGHPIIRFSILVHMKT